MANYNDLVRTAVQKAQNRQKDIERHTTIVTKHDNGADSVAIFYKKGSAIWCRMATGSIIVNAKVYKVDTDKPYIRNIGTYWYLGDREKACIKYLLEN